LEGSAVRSWEFVLSMRGHWEVLSKGVAWFWLEGHCTVWGVESHRNKQRKRPCRKLLWQSRWRNHLDSGDQWQQERTEQSRSSCIL
jgi:hypothetical protein